MGALQKAAHSKPETAAEIEKIDQFMQRTCGLTLAEIRMRDVGVHEWIDARGRDARVSTIYLWAKRMSHGSPECWETMVFGGPDGNSIAEERYFSRDEAIEGHHRWIGKAKEMVDAL